MFILFKTILLFISILGYYSIYKSFRLNSAFFPIAFVSYTVVFLYIAGIAGSLWVGLIIQLFLGIISTILFSYKKISEKTFLSPKNYCDPIFIILFIYLIYFYVITRTAELSHTDDFAHWYRICKMMLAEDAYPSHKDIKYGTYVPGTATWVYFINKIIGYNVQNCFFANNIIFGCGMVSFAAYIKKEWNKRVRILGYCLIYVLSACFVMMASNSMYTLLADTSLAIVALSTMVYLLYYCISRDSIVESKGAQVIFLIMLCFISLIKTAGLFFVILLSGTYFMMLGKDIIKRTAFASSYILIPFLLQYIYLYRIKRIFGSISEFSQAPSVKRYSQIFRDRLIAGDILDSAKNYLSNIFEVFKGSGQVTVLWLSLILFYIVVFYISFKGYPYADVFLKLFRYIFVMLLVYLLLIFVTYMLSMNTKEVNAEKLASFGRYIYPFSVLVLGTTVISILYVIGLRVFDENTKKFFIFCTISVCFLVCSSSFSSQVLFGYSYYRKKITDATKQYNILQNSVKENMYYSDYTYVILWDEDEYGQKTFGRQSRVASMYFRCIGEKIFSLQELRDHNLSDKELLSLSEAQKIVLLNDFTSEDKSQVIKQYYDLDDYNIGIYERTINETE